MDFSIDSIFQSTAQTTVLLLAALTVTSCTLSGIEDDVNSTITDDDLEAASQILGESLSADNSGLILSLNDALTTVSSDGFSMVGAPQKSTEPTLQNDSGRGNESEYSYSYNPETGVHTVSFKRSIDRPLFSKEVTDTLKYMFTDNAGEFIDSPQAEQERIESINYYGYRDGSVETPRKTSSFIRKDTLLINGVSGASPILQIDGVHNGNGFLEVERPNGNILERSYQLEINFLNIEIDKELSQRGLEQGVTGTLSWEMIIDKNNNGNESTKTLRGTIEMNGDGTALLRFQSFLKIFQVNLDNGDVKDQDREFEGRVISVDPGRSSFTLRSGRQIFINEETDFDDDISSLSEVHRALENGHYIWAEGEGYPEGDRFIATEAEFEREEDDDGDDDDSSDNDLSEFEELVTSVNLQQGTFTITGEVVIRINEKTEFEDDSDYQSLQQVHDAIDQGLNVIAEGEAQILQDDNEADLMALEVSFENEEDEDDDSDDDDDDDENSENN
ncbi:MAG: DUF5666 domain-containing protein [Balneolaceae bacterium]|nr:DUF5666 domain-containing protein [Balneolaceae bacterium]